MRRLGWTGIKSTLFDLPRAVNQPMLGRRIYVAIMETVALSNLRWMHAESLLKV